MCRAVEALFVRFPDIQRDVTQAKQNSAPLIKKFRLVRYSIFPLTDALYACERTCDYVYVTICTTICAIYLTGDAN